jgi:CRISPR-associated endonuclease Csn1
VRGRIKKGKNGKVSWKQGDSIRGQLHKETFFGAIKPPVYENGYAKKENGKYMVRRKNDIEEIWIVARKPIESVDIAKDKIIDEVLKEYIEKQLVSGSIKSISEARDFSGNKIRHLRCAFKAGRGYLTKEKAIELRRHSHPPKKEHRQYVLVQNSQDGNYLYLVYEKWEEATLIRKARIVTLLERQGKDFPGIKGLWNDKGYNQLDGVLLKYIVKVGQTTIFYSETKDELKELDDAELKKRVFVVYKFNESGTPDIYLKNMIEARPTPEIDKLCENSFDPKKYQVGLSLKVAKLNCVFEGKDFEIKPDGEIKWL